MSEVALGTLNFGLPGRPSAADADCGRILGAYREAGGTVLDTAPTYADGESELTLGRLLRGCRDQVLLGTKFGLRGPGAPFTGGLSRRSLVESLEGSLRRLRTDRVDVLWVHAWQHGTRIEELLPALDDQVRAGRVLYVGVCNTPAWVVSRYQATAQLRDRAPFSAMQVEYSLAQRDSDRELLPMARDLGLPVFAWSPLGRGRLLRPAGADEESRSRARLTVGAARELGVPPAAVAVAFVRAKGLIPVLGASSADHLAESLLGAHLRLPGPVLDRLERASAVQPGWPHAFVESVQSRMSG
ncbi:aldo/keto reductase [Kitasatospora sp. NPDC059571]|uniref:aldo/keto reductase n=1 Tax=Kitasatospora sp. NPDC059571 TaxID=3346871 RepID=UPI00368801E6